MLVSRRAFLRSVAHILAASCILAQTPTKPWATHCHTQSRWAIIPVNSSDVLKQLPPNFSLASHDIPGFPNGTHPMYLEFNHQGDCTEHIVPIKAPDMLEFKVCSTQGRPASSRRFETCRAPAILSFRFNCRMSFIPS
jgi:hypothetical protein